MTLVDHLCTPCVCAKFAYYTEVWGYRPTLALLWGSLYGGIQSDGGGGGGAPLGASEEPPTAPIGKKEM